MVLGPGGVLRPQPLKKKKKNKRSMAAGAEGYASASVAAPDDGGTLLLAALKGDSGKDFDHRPEPGSPSARCELIPSSTGTQQHQSLARRRWDPR